MYQLKKNKFNKLKIIFEYFSDQKNLICKSLNYEFGKIIKVMIKSFDFKMLRSNIISYYFRK